MQKIVAVIYLIASGSIGFAFVTIALRYPEIRRIRGAVLAALASILLFVSSILALKVQAALAAHAVSLLLLARAAWLFLQHLGQEQVVRTAFFDTESRLPNRAEWKKWRNENPDAEIVRLRVDEITSTRRLAKLEAESAFFDALGNELANDDDLDAWFIARTGVSEIAFGTNNAHDSPQATIGYRVERLRQALRSTGFQASFYIDEIRSQQLNRGRDTTALTPTANSLSADPSID